MPSKRRHHQRKKISRSKKGKSTPLSSTAITHPEAVAQPVKPATSPSVAAPSADIQTITLARYPYIAAELQRIGILAGIMLVILVVLSLVLS